MCIYSYKHVIIVGWPNSWCNYWGMIPFCRFWNWGTLSLSNQGHIFGIQTQIRLFSFKNVSCYTHYFLLFNHIVFKGSDRIHVQEGLVTIGHCFLIYEYNNTLQYVPESSIISTPLFLYVFLGMGDRGFRGVWWTIQQIQLNSGYLKLFRIAVYIIFNLENTILKEIIAMLVN